MIDLGPGPTITLSEGRVLRPIALSLLATAEVRGQEIDPAYEQLKPYRAYYLLHGVDDYAHRFTATVGPG